MGGWDEGGLNALLCVWVCGSVDRILFSTGYPPTHPPTHPPRMTDEVYAKANVLTAEAALQAANEIGYPVMVKASEGGGGKGIRKVENADTYVPTHPPTFPYSSRHLIRTASFSSTQLTLPPTHPPTSPIQHARPLPPSPRGSARLSHLRHEARACLSSFGGSASC